LALSGLPSCPSFSLFISIFRFCSVFKVTAWSAQAADKLVLGQLAQTNGQFDQAAE
jgi:hypothetical protein